MKTIIILMLVTITFGCSKKDIKQATLPVVDPKKELQFYLTEYDKSGEVNTSKVYIVPVYKK